MTMDVDGPVRPIDPADDARRLQQAQRRRRRGGATLVLTLLYPLLVLAAGALLGGWHAQAPVAGAIGMLLAWLGARAVLLAAATLALALEAPSLLRRLLGRPGQAGGAPLLRHSAGPVALAYVFAYAALAALAGLVAAWVGPGPLVALDLVAFALAGAGLAALTVLTEPA